MVDALGQSSTRPAPARRAHPQRAKTQKTRARISESARNQAGQLRNKGLSGSLIRISGLSVKITATCSRDSRKLQRPITIVSRNPSRAPSKNREILSERFSDFAQRPLHVPPQKV
jgi:hypothetical protein